MIDIFFQLLGVILLIGALFTSTPLNIILGVPGVICLLISGVFIWIDLDWD